MQHGTSTTSQSGPVDGAGDMGAFAALQASVERRLRAEGPRGVLALLNERTRFRFTGLYRVEPPRLHNVWLHDRENPAMNVSGAVCSLSDTYCAMACQSESGFTVHDALSDDRLANHPNQKAIQSYAGVPIRLAGGRVLGTLCHYDHRPRLLPAGELSVLHAVAPLLAPWLGAE